MPRLPALTAKEVIRALRKAGFIEDRQKGSHLVMWNPASHALTVIPVHSGRTIKRPLLHGILRDAKLSEPEFLKLL
ncbi:MAG: type II toxin-antitoxin system HicA family toxin [Candidatus Binataceae bacterium]